MTFMRESFCVIDFETIDTESVNLLRFGLSLGDFNERYNGMDQWYNDREG